MRNARLISHIQLGLWAHAVDGRLEYYQCPHGYCQCIELEKNGRSYCSSVYYYEQQDHQCNCNRKGECVCVSVHSCNYDAFTKSIVCMCTTVYCMQGNFQICCSGYVLSTTPWSLFPAFIGFLILHKE